MVREWVSEESRNGHRGAEVTGRCELPDGWGWDLNSGLPQGQLMFLTPAPFLWPNTLFWPPLARTWKWHACVRTGNRSHT